MNFLQQLDLAHAKYAFYDLHLDNRGIAENIINELKKVSAKNLLIVGYVGVANELIRKGFNVTIFATSDDMKNYIRKYLPFASVIGGDIKKLNSNGRFDAIICLGDTFSYFTDDRDVHSAFESFYRNLKYGGIILLENINSLRLLENNGSTITKVENENLKIKKTSTLIPENKNPALAVWKVAYELIQNDKRSVYEENSKIRGFAIKEAENFLKSTNFQPIKFLESGNGNNFLTIARK